MIRRNKKRLFLAGCMFCLMAASAVSVSAEKETVAVETVEVLAAKDPGFIPGEYKNVQTAAKELKDQLLKRMPKVTVKVKDATLPENAGILFNDIFERAYEEDPSAPDAGDYLRYNVYDMAVEPGVYQYADTYYYQFIISPVYCTDAEQEKFVADYVSNTVAGLKLEGKTDDEKVKAIYDHVTSHVKYDNEAIKNDYPGAHSAYNAAKGSAVCQGYAGLVYRMLREVKLPVRMITGEAVNLQGGKDNHAWNIVKLNGAWYNLDTTWDSILSPGDIKGYKYFLKGTAEFTDHLPEVRFLTPAFMNAHPISAVSYPKYVQQPEEPQKPVVKIPGVPKLTGKASGSSIKLTWKKTSDAKGYELYKLNAKTNKMVLLKRLTNASTVSFVDKKAGYAQNVVYAIRAYNTGNGEKVYSKLSAKD